MATVAFGVLVLTALVLLARPPAQPPTARRLPGAALQGALVLSRLSDRHRERLRPARAAAASVDRVPC